MRDEKKTKRQLISELEDLREQVLALKALEAQRKKADDALWAAGVYARSLIEASLDPFMAIDKNGKITDVNVSTEEVTGCSREELIGSEFYDYFTEPEKAGAGYQRVFSEGTVRDYELEIRHRDGHVTPVLYNASVYRDETGEVVGVFAAARDVTERRRIEERLKHFNAVLRAIRGVDRLITEERDIGRLLQGICDNLVVTRGYHNAWAVILEDETGGLAAAAETGLGKAFLPVAERLKQGVLTACGQKALSQSKVVAIEDPFSACVDCPLSKWYSGRGAMTVRLEFHKKVYGLLAVSVPKSLAADEEEHSLFKEVARDIAFALHSIELEEERERAGEALKESEVRYRVLFKKSVDGIVVADRETKKFKYANPALCTMLGYSEEELKEKGVEGIHPKEALEHALSEFEAQVSGEKILALGLPCLRKDGTILYVDVSAGKAVVDGVECSIGFFRDVTERRRAEKALKEAYDELEDRVADRTAELVAANKRLTREVGERRRAQDNLKTAMHELERSNKELEQFAYVASHDLQEPLRKVRSFSDRIRVKYADILDERGRDYLNRMEGAVTRMRSMVQDLLTLSRVTTRAMPFSSADLRDAAHDAVSDLEMRIRQTRGRVEIGDLPVIEADPLQMGQLLSNLISNALKFHRNGVPPVVKIYSEPAEASDRAQCRIFVEDNGIGFDEKYLDRIFQPFQRLHGIGKYEGIGIGLAICHRIARRHGGGITAQSTPGAGAAFIVTLPVKQTQGDDLP